MVLLVYGFIRASEDGWSDGLTVAAFAAVVFLVLFLTVERRSRQPITPLRMFRDRNRAGAYGMMLSLSVAMFGMFFFLTLFVQNILDFSPLRAGLAFLPVSVIVAISAGIASRLLPRWGDQTVHGGRRAPGGGGPGHDRRIPDHCRARRGRGGQVPLSHTLETVAIRMIRPKPAEDPDRSPPRGAVRTTGAGLVHRVRDRRRHRGRAALAGARAHARPS